MTLRTVFTWSSKVRVERSQSLKHAYLGLTNPGSARTIQIRFGRKAASLEMDANSISTLEWRS